MVNAEEEKEHHELHAVADPLPEILPDTTRESLNTLLNEYATRNKFVMVVTKSDARRLIFQCEKGGKYRQKRIEPEKRQRQRKSMKTDCPYRVRFSKLKNNQGFKLNKPADQNECFHNHPLDFDHLLSTSRGRKNHFMSKKDQQQEREEPEAEEDELDEIEPDPEPWRQCITKIESIFRRFEDNKEKTNLLIAALEELTSNF